MKFVTAFAVAIGLLAISAPQHQAYAAPSSRASDAWAREYARNASRQGQVLKRGMFGGLLGLGIGAATGGAAAGAAIGAGVGAGSGAIRRGRTFDQIHAAAYRDCMRGRR
jgi:hypothetical protein